MSYPINYPTPQGANVQIFNVNYSNTGGTQVWVKPKGASFVWFTLIGAGGGGDGSTTGGGSGTITNCMVPAFLIPDELRLTVGTGGPVSVAGGAGLSTFIAYQQKTGSGYTLLTANPGGTQGVAGSANAANYFSAMGIYQSIAGQTGSSGSQAASTTTFLSGGSASTTTGNYGYGNGIASNYDGFFITQPIIVGVGGGLNNFNGGIGCGGGLNGKGGDGLAVIITW